MEAAQERDFAGAPGADDELGPRIDQAKALAMYLHRVEGAFEPASQVFVRLGAQQFFLGPRPFLKAVMNQCGNAQGQTLTADLRGCAPETPAQLGVIESAEHFDFAGGPP